MNNEFQIFDKYQLMVHLGVRWVLSLQKKLKYRLVASIGVVCGKRSNQECQKSSKYHLVVILGVGWVLSFVGRVV